MLKEYYIKVMLRLKAMHAARNNTKDRSGRDGARTKELEMVKDRRDGKNTESKGTQAASSKMPSGMTISPQTRPS